MYHASRWACPLALKYNVSCLQACLSRLMKEHFPLQNTTPEVTGREQTGRDELPRDSRADNDQADVDNHYEFKADLEDTTQEEAQASSTRSSSPSELTPETFTG